VGLVASFALLNPSRVNAETQGIVRPFMHMTTPSMPALRTARSSMRHSGLARWAAMALLGAAISGCVVAPAHSPRYRQVPASTAAAPAPQAAPPMYFYPTLNQSDAQQERDRYECYRWAVAQTGVDPGMTPVRQVPASASASTGWRAPPPHGGEVAQGAVTGAVLGAATSSGRHAGQGAIFGAIFGAMMGAASHDAQQRAYEHARARDARDARAAAANAEAANGPMNNFRRAMTACMDGRGYRVQ
jgi:hypothetical protein